MFVAALLIIAKNSEINLARSGLQSWGWGRELDWVICAEKDVRGREVVPAWGRLHSAGAKRVKSIETYTHVNPIHNQELGWNKDKFW